jgi:alpha-1,2-glucosyltransferase
MSSLRQVWALPVALVTIANISATWFKLVSERAPEPYLVSIPVPKSRAES